MRVIVALPRSSDDDLLRSTGLTLTEYVVLMSLSEGENQELRMANLAAATALSASRITRVVDALQSRGQVVKRRYEGDARGNVATSYWATCSPTKYPQQRSGPSENRRTVMRDRGRVQRE
ncbi:MarR family transcriptional regulator [Streptomyces sp. NBC_01622]|uniref:MarR family transcriptional regulator n=1 Tax=Streptomyces sp. NBC_01622 TaxID=2975903 RepID=UPI0038670727|nr:MarR family transcriptional regulator [Streptomyces sp. NBC_01622]